VIPITTSPETTYSLEVNVGPNVNQRFANFTVQVVGVDMTTLPLAKRVVAPKMFMIFFNGGYGRGPHGRPPIRDRVRLTRVQGFKVGVFWEAFPEELDHNAYVLDKSFAG